MSLMKWDPFSEDLFSAEWFLTFLSLVDKDGCLILLCVEIMIH